MSKLFGGFCWYCHWGWPKNVADIYSEAVKLLDDNPAPLQFGPGHIVWGDENFDSAEWCLEHFDEYSDGLTDHEKNVNRWALAELAKIPLEERDVCPEEYDGENPGKFPPPEGVEMVIV